MIIPTGIGCDIGGFAGDAIPFARLLASVSGCLITHPNIMNAASLYYPDQRILYVEGFALDKFSSGQIGLQKVQKQRIGLLLDSGIDDELKNRHLQVVDACRASLGLDISLVEITDYPLKIVLKKSSVGVSWGDIENPNILIKCGKLLKEKGATAIAVVTRFPECFDQEGLDKYRLGKGVDTLSGTEAILSHLLVRELGLPCAHSPALNILKLKPDLDPRAAAEEIGFTFLPSVLNGLSTAPDLVDTSKINYENNCMKFENLITINDVGAAVVPDSAIGGDSILACIEGGIPIITVKNPSVLNVTIDSLGYSYDELRKEGVDIICADNYLHAAGFIAAMREGISLESLSRPIRSINNIH